MAIDAQSVKNRAGDVIVDIKDRPVFLIAIIAAMLIAIAIAIPASINAYVDEVAIPLASLDKDAKIAEEQVSDPFTWNMLEEAEMKTMVDEDGKTHDYIIDWTNDTDLRFTFMLEDGVARTIEMTVDPNRTALPLYEVKTLGSADEPTIQHYIQGSGEYGREKYVIGEPNRVMPTAVAPSAD